MNDLQIINNFEKMTINVSNSKIQTLIFLAWKIMIFWLTDHYFKNLRYELLQCIVLLAGVQQWIEYTVLVSWIMRNTRRLGKIGAMHRWKQYDCFNENEVTRYSENVHDIIHREIRIIEWSCITEMQIPLDRKVEYLSAVLC